MPLPRASSLRIWPASLTRPRALLAWTADAPAPPSACSPAAAARRSDAASRPPAPHRHGPQAATCHSSCYPPPQMTKLTGLQGGAPRGPATSLATRMRAAS
eukprot:5688370-Pleurochrysis_carterae.AAC.1